jgi:hypothetical protein
VLTRRYWLKTCLLLRTGDSITLTSITSEPNSTFLQHASTAAHLAVVVPGAIMQVQGLQQCKSCSQGYYGGRVVRPRRLLVLSDASARVRGDARRVHRWLSDVRHWTSFYPGMRQCLTALQPAIGGRCILIMQLTAETRQSTLHVPCTRAQHSCLCSHNMYHQVSNLLMASALPGRLVNAWQ